MFIIYIYNMYVNDAHAQKASKLRKSEGPWDLISSIFASIYPGKFVVIEI